MPQQVTSAEDSHNPYALPGAHQGAPLMKSPSDIQALRRELAPLESSAKAVGIVCIVWAIFEVAMVAYYGGWTVLVKLGAISTFWPFSPTANVGIALAAPVAVAGLEAGRGLHRLHLWSTWALGVYALALFLQFAFIACADLQRGAPMVALMTVALGAMLLTPVIALCRLDLGSILSKQYSRVVADTAYIRVRAKLPLAVRCVMTLLLLTAFGLGWSA
jgi:hypothetical protein